MNNYSLLGKNAYNETAQVLNNLFIDVLEVTPVFEVPLSRYSLSYCLSLPQFKGISRQAIQKLSTKFPQEADIFSSIQNAVADRFRQTITGSWLPAIQNQVAKVLKREFNTKKKLPNITKPSQLNPFMIRFFRQVNSI